MKALSDIGLVGLGVMGRNLALNMESKGLQVSVFNYIPSVTEDFLAGSGLGKRFIGARSYEELAASLSAPRKVFLMVTAGAAVDEVIGHLVPLLEPGDVIIDGGNSDFHDTARRTAELEACGLMYVGTGVSGGEEGALKGPSMMPGGSPAAWPLVRDIFQSISAQTADGEPCCDWVGPGGAGHFVKMVHNGIEYGDIELICECYQMMRDMLGMGNEEMASVFAEWNRGELESYLIEITAGILRKKDDEGFVLDRILDTAGQKGTGKWTVQAALDEGMPLPLIGEAVFARCLSALKEERLAASEILRFAQDDRKEAQDDKWEAREYCCHPERSEGSVTIDDLRQALLCSKIVAYAQGFSLLDAASAHYGWNLDLGGIALLWRGGCIIRSTFLGKIREALGGDGKCSNLMLAPYFRGILAESQQAWRRVVAAAALDGIPVPALSSALAYFDGYRCGRSGANLLQAQRDFFGAHTYERIDRPRGRFFHTDWK
ncbi:MAG: decarboxylating NADP(+)-dependent phosphogluconate dehydrogenase [Bacteroidales bacterium]|nr:decarboxylating NADP(+)-dependent phosphogluconate dehydrogenase [Bacteroidales bacterium]